MSFCLYCVGDFDRLRKRRDKLFFRWDNFERGHVHMYGEIVFYTHGSTIEYGGEIFAAGELTADILNFAPEDYRPIQRLLNRMKELARQYEDTLERGVWWELNNQLIELRSQLMRIIPVLIYDIFHIVPCSLRPPLHRECQPSRENCF